MDIKEALTIVIEELDKIMQENPDRATADTCNYLTELLDKTDE